MFHEFASLVCLGEYLTLKLKFSQCVDSKPVSGALCLKGNRQEFTM